MKKLVKFLTVLTAVATIAVVAGCKKKDDGKEEVVLSDSIYSMDLRDVIDGTTDKYETEVVVNGTWAQTYDKIISLAKKEIDAVVRTKLYHKAEDLLMSTGCIAPLYYYTDLYMIDQDVKNVPVLTNGLKFFRNSTVNESSENINVCLASEPEDIDPAGNSAVDGSIIIAHCFSGLMGYNDSGQIVADLAVDVPTKTTNDDGNAIYTFTLRNNLKFSDGTTLDADDFVYSWKRAAAEENAFDYGYLFEIVKGYGTDSLAVKSLDNGTKFEVTLTVDVPYFLELCAFPTMMPVKEAAVSNTAWATNANDYITCGAYKIKSWEHNTKLVLEKNDQYWNKDNIRMGEITMFLSDDTSAILNAYKAGTYDFIDDVPPTEIPNLQEDSEYKNELIVGAQLGTYYISFNVKENLLNANSNLGSYSAAVANQEIRKALSLLIDRNYLVQEVTKGGQIAASTFVCKGIKEADGEYEFYKNTGVSHDFDGYFDCSDNDEVYKANCAEAVEILKRYFNYDSATGKFTDVPSFTYLINSNTAHKLIAEYCQSVWSQYGITATIDEQEWNAFLNTRKDGQYTVARNGWVADYADAINFLDLWTSNSGNNDCQFGK